MISFGKRGNSKIPEFLKIASHIDREYSTLSISIFSSYFVFSLEHRKPESAPVPNPKFRMRIFFTSSNRLGYRIGMSQLASDAHPNAMAIVAIARMYSKPTTLRSM